MHVGMTVSLKAHNKANYTIPAAAIISKAATIYKFMNAGLEHPDFHKVMNK